MTETNTKEHEMETGAQPDGSEDATEVQHSGARAETPNGRRRRWPWIAGALAVVVAAGIALTVSSRGGANSVEATVAFNTAPVITTDLVVTEELSGTLGYGTADPIVFRTSDDGIETVATQGSGTVTDVVAAGSIVDFGDVLIEIGNEPVVVLEGSIPAYRSFNSRMDDGPDVQQLEQALSDLGYDPDDDLTIDEDFTSATADAIERMQEALGAEETGRLDVGDLVFVHTPFYVADVMISVGDNVNPGTQVLATSTANSGTMTGIASEGSVLGQGDVLFTVNGEPVALLLGDTPLYRSLAVGTEGADVEHLQASLVDLGFLADDANSQGTFDEATFNALVEWQASLGASPDGVVNVGDVVFSSDAIRVQENLASVGDQLNSGTQIMTTAINSTFVTVELSTDDQDLIEVGDAVAVELPSGDEESAVVIEIGSVVLANQQGSTYFEMTVSLDDPEAAQGLDEAPVDVLIVGDRAVGVTAVPVTALLALTEGGYAVEVVQSDGSTVLIGVEPGLFADGYVEVTASGLSEGMEVVIP